MSDLSKSTSIGIRLLLALNAAKDLRIRQLERQLEIAAKRIDAMEAEKRELATVTEMAPYRLIGKRS